MVIVLYIIIMPVCHCLWFGLTLDRLESPNPARGEREE